ncbi:Multidrug resistance-associated protein 1 [Podochytrium sp. JEL0797]|nr:Multidrug resistance-associated protein 1 [Podochytrium sp. JEL0797]
MPPQKSRTGAVMPLPKDFGGSGLGATGAGPCPKSGANPLSKLVFQWINPIFRKGWKRPLTMNDLWDIPENLRAQKMADKFEAEWTAELEQWNKLQQNKPKKLNENGDEEERVIDGLILRSCLWRLFKVEVFPLAFLNILSNLCNLLSPYMQQLLIEHVDLQGTSMAESVGKGLGFAFGLFGLQLLGSLISNTFQQELQIKSLAIKSMISTGIYRKALRLSPAARQKFSSGQVINMVTTDTMRIQMFMFQAIFIFTLPIMLAINIGFLIAAIGWAALVGLSLLIIAMPIQAWLFKKMKVIRLRQAPITDQRIKKTTEILNGIRVIKLFSWESSFFSVVESIRNEELVQVLTRSIYQAIVMTQGMTIPALCTCASFIAYGLMHPLDAAKVFSSMSWFNQLRMPLWMIPNILNAWAEFNVALTRIESLLLANEIDEEYAITLPPDSKNAIEIVDAEFNWTGPVYPKGTLPPAPPAAAKNGKPTIASAMASSAKVFAMNGAGASKSPANTDSLLKNISLRIPKGSLTAIVGSVGSGKSSLLNALIGEMRKVSGTVAFSDEMAYAAQTPWIQNATVRDNVLFGTKFEKARYLQALFDAALLPDLRILRDSDQTSIGEKGINLSGGQKQRINIARLMYNDARIVLLDDPLSAVDAHVGRHLFEKCILGAMKDRTRVLVTHQLHFLSQCDHIVYMKDGGISESGSYGELMASGGEFSDMMKTHGGATEDDASSGNHGAQDEEDMDAVFAELDKLTSPKLGASDIMSKEDQASGGVAREVWWRYIVACGGVWFCIQSVLLIAFNEGTTVVNNLWLTWWTSRSFDLDNTQYSLIYLGLALLSSLATFSYAYFFAFTGTRAGRIMHEKALKRILACPVYFFDTTPVGRIINRFSADVDALDNSVATNVRQLASTFTTTLSTFIVMIATLPLLVAIIIPCMGVYWFVQDVYRKTARELKRLSSTARSPLYNNFGESLIGISTIRAYRDQSRFIWRNDTAMDVSNSPNYYLTTAGNWLSIRLQLIGSVLVLGAAVLGITTSVLSATLFGLCLTYSLTITQTLAGLVQNFTQCEIAMNSAERVEHYAYRVETESDEGQHKPSPEWPAKGTIEFKDVTMRYAPSLPVVLDAVSFDIRDKEKVGIVGRTGSGKSSLMQALFRMVNASEGLITIDGTDINSISLQDLRQSLAIIPQDPVVFSGTFRFNMDPFGECSDAELWNALDRAGLKKKVSTQDGQLDALVDAGGENLSVGERQLLCLSRAMLKRPKILIMDEATANVDYETDSMIQKSLREDFKETTILTIAHRLNTIMD